MMKNSNNKNSRSNKTPAIMCLLLAALVLFALAGCNSAANDEFTESSPFNSFMDFGGNEATLQRSVIQRSGGQSYGAAFADFDMGGILPVEPPVSQAPGQTTSSQVEWEDIAGENQRHIIQNANVEMETEDFDRVVFELRQLIHGISAPARIGSSPESLTLTGYIESELLSTPTRGQRIFTIVMRVPASSFIEVLSHVESLATVRHTSQRIEDVTDLFYDMAGNLQTRRIEEERLLALIEEAENIHDLIALETRLSNTRQSIESYLALLNNMAGQIAFSTVTVTLHDIYEEIYDFVQPTFGERMTLAFGDSINGTVEASQDIIVFMAGAIIPLVILGAFAFTIFLIVKFLRKKLTI